ncbi:hypothetical protein ACTFSJ_27655 [Bacillus cereus group sp. MYBK12-2]|uniref:hypothetical protein n=1 Tax=Bacillus cereus group sp. MYBK12-2 TaxID=3450689 RepID=UPI003301B7FA|nr:zinc-finger domain-containing protein [Bacillus pacificus]HDR7653546.1 zinc-finger domain-containing protein [Bacillus pacificus]
MVMRRKIERLQATRGILDQIQSLHESKCTACPFNANNRSIKECKACPVGQQIGQLGNQILKVSGALRKKNANSLTRVRIEQELKAERESYKKQIPVSMPCSKENYQYLISFRRKVTGLTDDVIADILCINRNQLTKLKKEWGLLKTQKEKVLQ